MKSPVKSDSQRVASSSPQPCSAFVVRSGNGFVINPETGEMIGWRGEDKLKHDYCALMAKRFDRVEADAVAGQMRARGMSAEVVRLRIGSMPNAERIHGGAELSNQPETPTPLDGASC